VDDSRPQAVRPLLVRPLLVRYGRPVPVPPAPYHYDEDRDVNVVADGHGGVRPAVTGPDAGILTKSQSIFEGED
jgi:hypothetical protein